MNIAFLVHSLHYGGAERQLVTLAGALSARGHHVTVLTFYADGPLTPELRTAGVFVQPIGKRSRWDVLGFILRLIVLLRRIRPDVLHGYLAGPNIVAALLKPLLRGTRIVWGIRASDVDLTRYGRTTRMAYELERRMARFADLIICNSHAGREYVVQRGFPHHKTIVISNGIDTARFQPDAAARKSQREHWQVGAEVRLVGLVARLDPMKDHSTFLRAAAIVTQQYPSAHFVCVGHGDQAYGERLHALAAELGLCHSLLWAGNEANLPAVYNALDLVVLASAYGEGFPNVVGEAMACGVPCVVTDVGDAPMIVDDTGIVVPRRDPAALAAAIMAVLTAGCPTSDNDARQRIVDQFDVQRLVEQTEQALWLKG